MHLGDTVDDAAGEAFDKVARLLGLPYPGGPAIDRAARDGDPRAIAFPRPLTGPSDPPWTFSFSGLKTAVARWVEARTTASRLPVADVAASFQEAVADTLARKAVAACADQGADTLLMVGGVAANSRVRALVEERCAAAGHHPARPADPAVHRQRRDDRRRSVTCWCAPTSSPTPSTWPPIPAPG